jgi:hypothetical protein
MVEIRAAVQDHEWGAAVADFSEIELCTWDWKGTFPDLRQFASSIGRHGHSWK